MAFSQRTNVDLPLTARAGMIHDILLHRAGEDFERIYNKDLQTRGIDLVLRGTALVDEKAAIDYRQKDLRTYSFELSTKMKFRGRDGRDHWQRTDGWFMSDFQKNGYYMLQWFKSDAAIKNVESCETALVRKDAIKAYLAEKGLGTDMLSMIKDEILTRQGDAYTGFTSETTGVRYEAKRDYESGDVTGIYGITPCGLKVTLSLQKVEEPVNVIIPKEDLIRMAERTYVLADKIYDLDETYAKVFSEKAPEPVQIPKESLNRALGLFNSRTFIPSPLWFDYGDGNYSRQSNKLAFKPGLTLYYECKDQIIPIASFDGKKWNGLVENLPKQLKGPGGKLFNVAPIEPEDPEKYTKYATAMLEQGKVPIGFTVKNCMHQVVWGPSSTETPDISSFQNLTDIPGLTNNTILAAPDGTSYDVKDGILEVHIEDAADRELNDRLAAEEETELSE